MRVDKNTPDIRFKGFSWEWEDIGLLESIERIIDFRGRTPKKLGLDWSPSGYRALSALNVKQGYIDFSIDPHFGDQELYDKWMSGSELHQGQVLFTTEAPMGNVAQVPNADKYILSQRTIAFVVKPKVITDAFLAVLLRSSKVFQELSALSSGGTAKGVSQKVLANLNVLIPSDLDEQTAIGTYFQNLDGLINQHQQKHDKLSNLKKAMLEKMFPKQGETIPEIRFKGFSGEWEEKQLDDLCNLITKQTGFDYSASIKPSLVRKKSSQTYSFIQNKDFSGPRINLETDFFIPCEVANQYPRILIDVPSVLISISGKIGNVGFYQLPEKSLVGGAVGICKLKCASDGLVIVHQLLSRVGQEYFQTLTKSSSHANITVEDIRLIKVKLPPTIEEKNRIGMYFNQLDALLNQHQQQIAKLNNIKQACLSKMFV